MEDLYGILGVERGASKADIKTAYKNLAKKYHPDKQNGDDTKMKQINSAYDILKDPRKTAKYEQNAYASVNNGRMHRGGHVDLHDIIFDMQEIFGEQSPFGDPHNRHQTRRQYSREPVNKDIKLNIQLTLEEAFNGGKKTLSVSMPSGNREMIDIDIPAGVRHETFLKYMGMGDDSVTKKERGDLYINIHIEPHPDYIRQGNDLVTHKTIDCIDAMLGTSIDVKTLDNRKLSVKISKGVQHGTVMKLQGKGMPNGKGLFGDIHLIINVSVPSTLTPDHYDLLRQIKGESNNA